MQAVERLVAMQAQSPRDPYVALWSRLAGFDPAMLSKAIDSRRAVRMTLLRATLHLVSARDALALRRMFQPVVERMFFGQKAFRDAAAGIDLDEVVALFRRRLEERPGTRSDLSRVVAERWPDRDALNLGYALYLLPTVQVTPRGLWGRSARAEVTTLEHWLGVGQLDEPGAPPTELVRRYLAVFGPATPADFSNWSGLAGMREAFEELRPRLRTFRRRGRAGAVRSHAGPAPRPRHTGPRSVPPRVRQRAARPRRPDARDPGGRSTVDRGRLGLGARRRVHDGTVEGRPRRQAGLDPACRALPSPHTRRAPPCCRRGGTAPRVPRPRCRQARRSHLEAGRVTGQPQAGPSAGTALSSRSKLARTRRFAPDLTRFGGDALGSPGPPKSILRAKAETRTVRP